MTVAVVTMMWVGITTALVLSLWHMYQHMGDVTRTQAGLPRVLLVRALADASPDNNTRVVDGVLLRRGDALLVWPRNVVAHRAAVWRLYRRGWAFTDELRELVPGSLVTVGEGLRYAHHSFTVGKGDSVAPTWQHILLSRKQIDDRHIKRWSAAGPIRLNTTGGVTLNATPVGRQERAALPHDRHEEDDEQKPAHNAQQDAVPVAPPSLPVPSHRGVPVPPRRPPLHKRHEFAALDA